MKPWRVLVLLSLLWACGPDPGALDPEGCLSAFLSALSQSTHAPSQRKTAFEWIDEESQAALTERAKQASALAGTKLEPWELLTPGRVQFVDLLRGGVRLRSSVSGDRAVIQVPVEGRAPATVELVRQGGRWRVVLGLTRTNVEP